MKNQAIKEIPCSDKVLPQKLQPTESELKILRERLAALQSRPKYRLPTFFESIAEGLSTFNLMPSGGPERYYKEAESYLRQAGVRNPKIIQSDAEALASDWDNVCKDMQIAFLENVIAINDKSERK